MNKLYIILLLTLSACGSAPDTPGASTSPVTVTQSCAVAQDASGATITCPDGSTAVLAGASVVSLCPAKGYYAVCVDDVLYAETGGYFTELKPGATKVGSCNVVVGPGCTVK